VELGRAAVLAGITDIVATPHVSYDWPNTSTNIRDGVSALAAAFEDAKIPLRVRGGAEVALTRAVDLDDAELARLRLGGGEWLLVECPLSVTGGAFKALVLRLAERGHRIVLAHPERCPELHRSPDTLRLLVDDGALTQVTAGALSGAFGRIVREFALDLLATGLVHNVASDAHDHIRRPPGMLAGLAAAEQRLPGTLDHADWLCTEVPRAILHGGAIPAPPGPPPRRRPRRWRIGRLGARR
jgi:protein-tyrosine phosphatase